MIRVVVLHGAQGGPNTNWFPWLQKVLELQGMEILRPQFPTPEGQSLVSWLDTYDDVIGRLPTLPTVLVGHSLGAAFALRLIKRSEESVAGLFLAAAFGSVCKCWAGDDDPYVPLARPQEVADKVGPDLEVSLAVVT
jgi:predicted alpha/beta hydrolase family esterase